MNQPASNRVATNAFLPEQETARLLELCEAQIEAALRDSDKSVEVLTNVFFQLIAAIDGLNEHAKKVGASPDAQSDLDKRCGDLSEQINSAVVAFQFYDKLTQRLDHVRHSLTTLALFICDRDKSQRFDQWQKLRSSLRRLYRTAEERKIFDNVAGPLINEEPQHSQDYAAASSVELF